MTEYFYIMCGEITCMRGSLKMCPSKESALQLTVSYRKREYSSLLILRKVYQAPKCMGERPILASETVYMTDFWQ